MSAFDPKRTSTCLFCRDAVHGCCSIFVLDLCMCGQAHLCSRELWGVHDLKALGVVQRGRAVRETIAGASSFANATTSTA